jgi:hypothetical protein
MIRRTMITRKITIDQTFIGFIAVPRRRAFPSKYYFDGARKPGSRTLRKSVCRADVRN